MARMKCNVCDAYMEPVHGPNGMICPNCEAVVVAPHRRMEPRRERVDPVKARILFASIRATVNRIADQGN